MKQAMSSHPWENHLNVRGRFKITSNFDAPFCDPPPRRFNKKENIKGPNPSKALSRRECISLADVVEFRRRHKTSYVSIKRNKTPGSDDDFEIVDAVSEEMDGFTDQVSMIKLALEELSIAKSASTTGGVRPVLYRYLDVRKQKGAYTILEAVHFEVFMPDRKDLRFVAVPTQYLPKETVEGHFFAVFDLTSLLKPLKPIKMQDDYPIVWEVKRTERVAAVVENPFTDLVYIANILAESRSARAVCNWSQSFITVPAHRFIPSHMQTELTKETMYEATLMDTSSAWIFPVEPPKNRSDYAKLVSDVRSSSLTTGVFVDKMYGVSPALEQLLGQRVALNMVPERFMLDMFTLSMRYREHVKPPEMMNVRVQSLNPPELIVMSEVFGVSYITLFLSNRELPHNEEKEKREVKLFLHVNSIKHPKRGNNRHSILRCAENQRLVKEFPGFNKGKGPNGKIVWLNAQLHSDNEAIALTTINRVQGELDDLENPIGRKRNPTMSLEPPPVFHYLYDKMPLESHLLPRSPIPPTIRRANGTFLTLNERQHKAMVMYHSMDKPAFCILSPPGSGKTTVAAAMTASLVDDVDAFRPGEVQLLLAVQNVAVENLSVALQAFDDNRLRVYYIKSLLRTDAESKLPYDIKELLPNYQLYMENAADADLVTMQRYIEVDSALTEAKAGRSKLSGRQKYKLNLDWHKCLRKAKLTLEKYLQPQIILSTVDLILCQLANKNEKGVRRLLGAVTRIVIDEASLLTESTFYCLVRLFPNAKFVLIGDDQQLPPFMFDESVVGHLLSARSALSIAMHSGNLPVVKLLEVYRAPPRLVDPYNGLSYDGALVSRKPESLYPLASIGFVGAGQPQLLFIANSGGHRQGPSKSLCNEKEIASLIALLKRFPEEAKRDIMIICLYKDQKKSLEKKLGTNYELHTVDSSQGKEKPIVIVLTTRSDKSTPFFASKPRATVAVSRQQQALIIIGNRNLLTSSAPWSFVLAGAHFTSISSEDLGVTIDKEDEVEDAVDDVVDDENDFTAVPMKPPTKFTVTDFLEAAKKAEDYKEETTAPLKGRRPRRQ